MAAKTIHIAAALIVDEAGRLLLVRKRNTVYFMQPGGKLEPGERPEAALIRELSEELGLNINPADLQALGQFTDVAANEPDHQLVAEIFRIRGAVGDISPAAEIEEAIWLLPAAADSVPLAPLTARQILPLALSAGA